MPFIAQEQKEFYQTCECFYSKRILMLRLFGLHPGFVDFIWNILIDISHPCFLPFFSLSQISTDSREPLLSIYLGWCPRFWEYRWGQNTVMTCKVSPVRVKTREKLRQEQHQTSVTEDHKDCEGASRARLPDPFPHVNMILVLSGGGEWTFPELESFTGYNLKNGGCRLYLHVTGCDQMSGARQMGCLVSTLVIFSHHCNPSPNKNHLSEEEFISAHTIRWNSHHREKALVEPFAPLADGCHFSHVDRSGNRKLYTRTQG